MASYQVVGQSRQELLDEFLAAVSESREARFCAISLDNPSLIPELVCFEVSVKEIITSNTRPTLVTVTETANLDITFQIALFKNQETVRFEIIL